VIAIDTNIVVRFLANDDPDQSQRARHTLLSGDVYVSLTVCLETEWVLRSVYRASREKIARKLTELSGIQGLTVEDPETLATAIEWFRGGMDFADALHLSGARHCSAMLSFDAKFAKVAKGLAAIPVRSP
jgi:predicted nucleic-acid-binding protein